VCQKGGKFAFCIAPHTPTSLPYASASWSTCLSPYVQGPWLWSHLISHFCFLLFPILIIFCLPPSSLVLSAPSSYYLSPSFRVPLLSHACLLYLGLRVSLRFLLSLVSRLSIVSRLPELGLFLIRSSLLSVTSCLSHCVFCLCGSLGIINFL
jgi:hypothetical protein